VIYCHGNSGNRTESYDTVCCMLRLNILVISFDFAGFEVGLKAIINQKYRCGLSEGSYISLGHNEQNDLAAVFSHIKNNFDFIDQKRWVNEIHDWINHSKDRDLGKKYGSCCLIIICCLWSRSTPSLAGSWLSIYWSFSAYERIHWSI